MHWDSDRLLSRHREAGSWWEGESYREVLTYVDDHGIRRTETLEHPSLARTFLASSGESYQEDHREDLDLKIQKVRDEKVSRACGLINENRLTWAKRSSCPYVALHAQSGYSFGRSAMMAEEIPAVAASLGVPAVLLADSFSLAGAAEFVKISQQVGVQPLIGASFELPEGGEVVLVAQSRTGFRNLSRLTTACHLEEPRLFPLATWERMARHLGDLLFLTGGMTSPLNWLVAQERWEEAERWLIQAIRLYGNDRVFVQIERSYLPFEKRINRRLMELAERFEVVTVAGGPLTHARREHFPVIDVNACVQSLCGIDEVEGHKPLRGEGQVLPRRAIPRRPLNAERYLKSPEDMSTLFSDCPGLLERTMRLAERCDPDVLPPRAPLPVFCENEPHLLRSIVESKLGLNVELKLQKRVQRELDRIIRLGFSGHFLVAWDACQWAREQKIHYSARGSVVDSVVAYYLGLSRINAYENRLHFDRFLPDDGTKRPDIDIDFEAKRREDIRQYFVRRYGEKHVATVAAVGAFSTRGIVREVGKVMGLPEDAIRFLAKKVHAGIPPAQLESALERRPELRQSNIPRERFRWVFRLAERLTDLPRNMRAHSSGVIISRDPVCDYVPVQHSGVESVPIIQWDKRSAKRCFDKFDILCLRGQDVLSQTEEGIRRLDLDFCVEDVPVDDPETFRTFRAGNLIGIPQSASPAMRQAHVRLRTENLTDASLVQAGIRPGVGGAVKINELIERRRGKPYGFDHPKLREILGNTYGIIVFQEQVDLLLQEFAGYTSGEAEDIRESIHKRRRESFGQQIREEVCRRIVDQGYSQVIADRVYEYVSGFNGYGFAQGHALAFAEISIRSVWCQQNYPAEYFSALLNAQPAGYYGPTTIANEARNRGVKILRPDLNRSGMDCSPEDVMAENDPKLVMPNGGIRVGLAYLFGIQQETRERIAQERLQSPFEGFADFVRRVRPHRDELECLVRAGFFDSIQPHRRALFWAIPEVIKEAESVQGGLPLVFAEPRYPVEIEDFTCRQKAVFDRRMIGLDIDAHLMAFERPRIRSKGGFTTQEIQKLQPGTECFAVGNAIRLRFPPTQSGKRVVFFDLEDETGLLNVTCFDRAYQRYGKAIICSPYLTVVGRVQDRDGSPAFLLERAYEYRPDLRFDFRDDEVLPLPAGDFIFGGARIGGRR